MAHDTARVSPRLHQTHENWEASHDFPRFSDERDSYMPRIAMALNKQVLAHLLFLVVKINRNLSLRRLLQKMLTFHHHIRSILRIAWTTRFSPFLEGHFEIVSVPAAPNDISIQFSQKQVLHAAFPPEDTTAQNVRKMVYDQLLDQFQLKAKDEGIDLKMKTGNHPELSLKKINVHAECSLLAYHLQNPEIYPYHYFGGSKLSCYACDTFFSAFNTVAQSFGHPKFYTRGCHNKLSLQWPSPSDRKSTRLNSSHSDLSRMPSSA